MRREKWIVGGCVHVEESDPAAQDFFIEEIRREKPHGVVLNGDLLEATAASRFPTEAIGTLKGEYVAGDAFLRRIRAAAPPGSRLVFIEGNHDANILAAHRIPQNVRELTDYREWVTEIRDGHWERIPHIFCRHRGVFRRGQLAVTHGFEAGVSAEENQALLLGIPFGIFVMGHTHRPRQVFQVMKTKRIGLPYFAANTGCLREMVNVPYMPRNNRTMWGQGCFIGETMVYDDDRLPMRREWDGRVEQFQTFDEAVARSLGSDEALPGSFSDPPMMSRPVDDTCKRILGAMKMLASQGTTTATRGAIAAATGIAPTTTSTALFRLEESGLAERSGPLWSLPAKAKAS